MKLNDYKKREIMKKKAKRAGKIIGKVKKVASPKMRPKVLDALWSKIVRKRDEFKCQRCQKQYESNSSGLHAHHLLTKGAHGFSVRWEIKNGVSVCYGCHSFLQSNPAINEEFAKHILGSESWNWLKRLGKKAMKKSYPEEKQRLMDILYEREP